ncbi:MAG: hypothetical protein ACI4PO_03780 [Faecousia sp.]
MNIEIERNRRNLWQWDLNQRLILTGVESGEEVHFEHGDMALSVKTYEDSGAVYADIPNICLQESGTLPVYIYSQTETCTMLQRLITIKAREKPEEYVYTETELASYKRIAEQYEKNVHYEQMLRDVRDTLTPLADDLPYMTYRDRGLVYETDITGNYFDDGNHAIKCGYFPITDLKNAKDLEIEVNFKFKSNYSYGVAESQTVRIKPIVSRPPIVSSSFPTCAAGIMQFGKSIGGVSAIGSMEDNDEKTSILNSLTSPIAVQMWVDRGIFYISFVDPNVYAFIRDNMHSTAHHTVKIYEIKYYTRTELSEALDILNGEVV